jgi:hypothetical protein
VEQQYAGNAALTDLKNIKNNRAESKKIAVEVFGERARTEETDVKKQNAENIALTALQNIKNKFDEVVARDQFEELDVQKRDADDDDTQHQHHHHHQEQARRV